MGQKLVKYCMDKIQHALKKTKASALPESLNYPPTPVIFNTQESNFEKNFLRFLKSTPVYFIHDNYVEQLTELFFLQNPQYKEDHSESQKPLKIFLDSNRDEYGQYSYTGTWIYYPWNQIIMHILDERSYFDLRTHRNRFLITPHEQKKLYEATLGIAGLSVGNSVALTLAYTGVAKTMKLADPDVFALSNLNRVRVPAYYIGAKKVYVAAQQIYEINPYADLILYPEGLTQNNLRDFLVGKPQLDLVVDEMDNLKMKIFIRLAARSVRLPVVMATDNSDNGIVDVDRFDIDPHGGPFGGLPAIDLETVIKGINFGEPLDLTMEEKIRLSSQIVGPSGVATRMQDSLKEVGKTIASWPQLGISAFLGGVNTAYVVKGILLGQSIASGKKHISLDEIFLDDYRSNKSQKIRSQKTKKFVEYIQTLNSKDIPQVWTVKERDFPKKGSLDDKIRFLIKYAILAPSTHNTQPWKFTMRKNQLILNLDNTRALPNSDPKKREAYLSIGAALENTLIAASYFGLNTDVKFIKNTKDEISIQIRCSEKRSNYYNSLFSEIVKRFTDRSLFRKRIIPKKIVIGLNKLNIDPHLSLNFIQKGSMKNELAALLGNASIESMKNILFRKELAHWIRNNFTKQRDGFSIGLPDIQSLIAPFLMHEVNLERRSKKSREHIMVENSPAVIIISTQADTKENWIKAGQLYERVALYMSKNGLRHSIHAAIIEHQKSHQQLRTKLGIKYYPQVFIRIGYGKGPIQYTPRRDDSEVFNI